MQSGWQGSHCPVCFSSRFRLTRFTSRHRDSVGSSGRQGSHLPIQLGRPPPRSGWQGSHLPVGALAGKDHIRRSQGPRTLWWSSSLDRKPARAEAETRGAGSGDNGLRSGERRIDVRAGGPRWRPPRELGDPAGIGTGATGSSPRMAKRWGRAGGAADPAEPASRGQSVGGQLKRHQGDQLTNLVGSSSSARKSSAGVGDPHRALTGQHGV